jgi:hypothetical protein
MAPLIKASEDTSNKMLPTEYEEPDAYTDFNHFLDAEAADSLLKHPFQHSILKQGKAFLLSC